jgi:AmiR/NasT family two-component response regulator
METLSSLGIALADGDTAALKALTAAVSKLGHLVLCSTSSTDELLAHPKFERADLVILDVSLLGDGGLQTIAAVLDRHVSPVIVTSAAADDPTMALAHGCRPLAHLVKPVSEGALLVSISVAMSRFEELQLLRTQAKTLRQALQDRKTIERAKGILMRQCELTSDEAARRLEQTAQNQGLTSADIAKAVLMAEPNKVGLDCSAI